MINQDLLNKLESKENFIPSGAANDEDIVKIEERFQIKLSEDYKYFLKNYGSAIWFGQAVYGVGEGPRPERFNLDTLIVSQKVLEQENYGMKGFPDSAIVLNKYEGGGQYILFSESSEHKGKVALRDHSSRGQLVEWWPNFTDWLKYILQF